MSKQLITKKSIKKAFDSSIEQMERIDNYQLENREDIHNCRMIIIDHAITCRPENATSIARQIIMHDLDTMGKYLSNCKSLVDKLVENKLCSSNEEAVELIRSGSLTVNNVQISSEDVDIEIPDFLYEKIEIGSNMIWVKECGNAQQ